MNVINCVRSINLMIDVSLFCSLSTNVTRLLELIIHSKLVLLSIVIVWFPWMLFPLMFVWKFNLNLTPFLMILPLTTWKGKKLNSLSLNFLLDFPCVIHLEGPNYFSLQVWNLLTQCRSGVFLVETLDLLKIEVT